MFEIFFEKPYCSCFFRYLGKNKKIPTKNRQNSHTPLVGESDEFEQETLDSKVFRA